MRLPRLLFVPLTLLIITTAHAQVGVEAGVLTAGSAGAVNPLQKLGAALSRSVFSSTNAIPAATAAAAPAAPTSPAATSLFTLSAGQPSVTRCFAPQATGAYVAGIAWRTSGNTSVTLQVGDQRVTGTTAAPVTARFSANAYSLCSIAVQAPGATGTLSGDLQVMREPAPGQAPSKSLLTPAERQAQRGCRPSLLPLLVQLAERHLKGVPSPTDLDQLFDVALKAAPEVSVADLQALVSNYDATPDSVKAQSITAATRILRTLPDPTLAGVRRVLGQPQLGSGTGFVAATAGPPAIAAIQPAADAYPAGATVQLVGQNFAPQPERNQVYLGTDLSHLLSGRPLPVTAASATELRFQLPANLPDGSYCMLVMVDRKLMSPARSLRLNHEAPMPAEELTQSVRPVRYRLSLTRLECVGESAPKWWTDDNVALLATAVADEQEVTRALGPQGGFRDGVAWDLPADRQALTGADGVSVAQGLGLAVELWQWQSPAPATGLEPWALREAFGNALAAPHPRFDDPKSQDDVSAELTVDADLIGREQLIWTAQQLQALLQPGQKLTKTLDLRLGSTPEQYAATGYYRLTVELQRVD